jgi:hypothetical protein
MEMRLFHAKKQGGGFHRRRNSEESSRSRSLLKFTAARRIDWGFAFLPS